MASDVMTGEGIGQALLTGRLAAEAILAAGALDPITARSRYEASVRHHLVADHRMSAALGRVLAHERGARGAIRILDGAGAWGRRNFARWMFEDEPRALLLTPSRAGAAAPWPARGPSPTERAVAADALARRAGRRAVAPGAPSTVVDVHPRASLGGALAPRHTVGGDEHRGQRQRGRRCQPLRPRRIVGAVDVQVPVPPLVAHEARRRGKVDQQRVEPRGRGVPIRRNEHRAQPAADIDDVRELVHVDGDIVFAEGLEDRGQLGGQRLVVGGPAVHEVDHGHRAL